MPARANGVGWKVATIVMGVVATMAGLGWAGQRGDVKELQQRSYEHGQCLSVLLEAVRRIDPRLADMSRKIDHLMAQLSLPEP